MKILYVITQGENGGAQKNVLDTAIFNNKTNEVHVAVGRTSHEKNRWLLQELEQNSLKKNQLHTFQNLVRSISPFTEVKGFFEIYNYIKQNKFDIVHLHSTKAGMLGSVAGKIAGALVVYTVHGFVFQEPMNIFKKMFYIAAEFTASFFIDHHICVSQKDAEIGRKFWILRNPKKYTIIYNGIDVSQNNLLSRDSARKILSEKVGYDLENVIVFGSIANLYATKGLTYFVEATKILKERGSDKFVCAIFGEGELRNNLEKQIREAGLEQEFRLLGYTKNAAQYLSGLDVFVMSSVKEGLPYALVEASRAELPIIATSVGGIPEMSKQFKINIVEAKNPESIAEEMQKMLGENYRLANKSAFNEIFSLQNMLDQTARVYKTILE
jgi:glycosyltransferase involved in cell wall biosynthesis